MPQAISKDRWSQMFDDSAPVESIPKDTNFEVHGICSAKDRLLLWEKKSHGARSAIYHGAFIDQSLADAKALQKVIEHFVLNQMSGVAEQLAKLSAQTELQKKFQSLADEWEEDVSALSSPIRMAQHTAYQEIIRMGQSAIPLILNRMKLQGGHWFWALSLITGEDPIPAKSRGRVNAMQRAWIKWGTARGHC